MSADLSCPQCRLALLGAPSLGRCPRCGAAWDDLPRTVANHTPTLRSPAANTPQPGAVTPTAVGTTNNGWRGPPRIPNYRDLTYLAGGGMGAVFRGVQCGVERTVAIKVISRFSVSDPAARTRFGHEMQALGRVKHPGVVQVYDSGEADDTPFYAMEYVGGGSLAQRLNQCGGALPLDEAARIIAAVAEGVEAAHRESVLHRDIKPGNILLTEEGEPKIADFGLAKFTDSNYRMTMTGSQLGTPAYMAPEQVNGEPTSITARSDVYGLGATLYECLTGRPPFKGATPQLTTHLVVTRDPDRPSQLRPDVPPELDAICLKCLAKNPAHRYATAQELADDLNRWRAGESPTARLPNLMRRSGRWLARNATKVLVASLAVALVVVIGASWGYTPEPADEVARREIEATLARKKPVTLIADRGPPKWHQWHDNPVMLSGSILGDGTCGFEAMGVSVLTLLRDPMVDSYRVSVELRHVRGPREGSVGLALGFDDVPHPTVGLTQWWAFEYSDVWQTPEKHHPAKQARHSLVAGHMLDIRGPAGDGSNRAYRGNFRFTPTDDYPNHWRRLDVEVSPNGMTVFWQSDPANAKLDKTFQFTRMEIEAALLDHNKASWPELGGAKVPPHPWNPRKPVGIVARHASVAVRNLIVTPN